MRSLAAAGCGSPSGADRACPRRRGPFHLVGASTQRADRPRWSIAKRLPCDCRRSICGHDTAEAAWRLKELSNVSFDPCRARAHRAPHRRESARVPERRPGAGADARRQAGGDEASATRKPAASTRRQPCNPRSTAAGRGPTRPTAARRWSSTSRRSPRWDKQKQHDGLRGRVLHAAGRAEARARHNQARGRHRGVGGRAARQLLEYRDHRSRTSPTLDKEQLRDGRRGSHERPSRDEERVIAPRPRAGQPSTRARSSRRTSRA